MKILHSVFTKGWGGLEKYPLTLVEEFKIKGHEIVIVTLEGTRLHEEALKRGVKVYTIKNFKKLSFSIIRFLKKILIEEKIDILHLNSSRELYNWDIALKGLIDIRVFLSFHIGVPNHRGILHKFLYKKIDGVLAISSQNIEEMKVRLPIEEKKLHLVYNGVDLKKFNSNVKSEIRDELGLKNEDILITAIGNLNRGKGIFEYLEAGENLLKEHENLFFIWVGDGSYSSNEYSLESLNSGLVSKGIDRIKLLGYREDISQILKGSNLFVLPAHEEAFGIVYIEAMAMGLPVIGCRAGGVVDIIQEGTGFLCEPKNAVSLEKTIELSLETDLEKMGQNNIEYVKRFSMEKYVENLTKIYLGD